MLLLFNIDYRSEIGMALRLQVEITTGFHDHDFTLYFFFLLFTGIQLNVKGQAKVLFTDCSFWEETTYRANEVYLQVHAPLLSDGKTASMKSI